MSAVIFYSRATSTSSKRGKLGERGSISIAADLTADQLKEHDAIVAVRNQAIAHVYPSETVADDVWHDAQLSLIETPNGWRPAFASRAVQFHPVTFEGLKRQIPVARVLISARFHKRLDAMTILMREHPVPMAMFERCFFDPVETFGSLQAVHDVVAGQDAGLTTALMTGSRPMFKKP